MLIDTHCHLDFKDFDADRPKVISRARDEGIIAIINVGSSLKGTKESIELAEKFDLIYAACGIHPHEADSVSNEDLKLFDELLKKQKIIAIGEIGLDYYKNISSRNNQRRLFIELLGRAKKEALPVIIHNREANDDVMGILKDTMGIPIKGVMHCFSGDKEFLNKCLDLGMHVSFTCNLTFNNAGRRREIARYVPIDRLLLETDAPFLAPQIFRGKRNEPAYVRYLAEEIGKIKGLTFEKIAEVTTDNARCLFGIGC